MAAITLPDRVMSLDDPGDVSAPKGSQPWARAIRYQLQRLDREGKARVRDFQIYLKLLEDHHGYQQFEDAEGHPFASLTAFVTGPAPFGLGYNPEIILQLQQETRDMLLTEKMQEVEAQRTRSEAQQGNQNARKDKNDPYYNKDRFEDTVKYGTDPAYLRRRLKRDHPDVFAALQRKEYRSVQAAAKAAGLMRQTTPLQVLQRVWKKASDAERLQFFRELPDSQRALLLVELDAIETRPTSLT